MCQETVFWALIVTKKKLQLQRNEVRLTTWTLCIHNFQAIISCLTFGTVSMSLYAVVLLKVGGGGGGAKSSVNFVMGSWHPCALNVTFAKLPFVFTASCLRNLLDYYSTTVLIQSSYTQTLTAAVTEINKKKHMFGKRE